MWLRFFLVLIACASIGCSGSVFSGGDLNQTGRSCLSEADKWLTDPKNERQLKLALNTVATAKKNFEKDEKARDRVVFGDLDLLYGALSMAKTGAEYGQDPTKPSSMSEVPVVVSVRIVANQLREHLTKTPTPSP